MSLFAAVPVSPPDPVFQTKAAYEKDTDNRKVNLGIGAYRDDNGKPWVLPSVRRAEQLLMERAPDHEYLPISGLADLYTAARELILGKFGVDEADKVASLQTLSGTGSLRVVAEFIAEHLPGRTVYLPVPTWGNHDAVLQRARLNGAKYRYLDNRTLGLDFQGFLDDLHAMPTGSIVLLHACAHNPTGVDPSSAQWDALLDTMRQRSLVPWFDCAYQGFASGNVARDRYAIEAACARNMEIFVSQSFAKNFGLYGERTGAAHVVCVTPEAAKAVASQLALIARPMYSNPPAYGARLVATVLRNAELRAEWERNLQTMSGRISAMRKSLRTEIEALGTPGSWSHLTEQIGMFAYTGLKPEQVDRLTRDWHVYLLRSGRISMAGVTTANVAYLARAIHDVVTASEARV